MRILRGDFHRHTEIFHDGSGDGSVEDYFRYMMDAAAMDTGIISDHNSGADNEYTWWRIEKAIDLFHIKDFYTPLFGYERSVPYPNGHRNMVFAERGVRTVPISDAERHGKVNSGPILYPYLKQHRGICLLHSMATEQGTDYRDNDPEVEPLVEIYQGFHANYEYEGAPRAESANFQTNVHEKYQPAGFYWNALAKGYKLGIESSSDHISTHSSYTMIYTPSMDRTDIVESMRKRHAYGATDNIIVDFQAVDEQGRAHMMGDTFAAPTAPHLKVKVFGTDTLQRVEIIKDGKFVFTTSPNAKSAEFTYIDNEPPKGESWYYVRVTQMDRNLAWSSPIWVKYGSRCQVPGVRKADSSQPTANSVRIAQSKALRFYAAELCSAQSKILQVPRAPKSTIYYSLFLTPDTRHLAPDTFSLLLDFRFLFAYARDVAEGSAGRRSRNQVVIGW